MMRKRVKKTGYEGCLRFHPVLAPAKRNFSSPLSKKLGEEAWKVCKDAFQKYVCQYDETGSIGKRYRRQG